MSVRWARIAAEHGNLDASGEAYLLKVRSLTGPEPLEEDP